MKFITNIVYVLKKKFNCKTYHIENFFVLFILLTVRFISGGFSLDFSTITLSNQDFIIWIADWIALCAVYFTFVHASIAERMYEAEEKNTKENKENNVECFYKLKKAYYSKEILWLITFTLLSAWSALVGVFIFLLFPIWRKAWRKQFPL
ncbi:MAG: putative membrane protein [Flavobacteriaceae bacterium]|jgi:uncharacterized membrane protein